MNRRLARARIAVAMLAAAALPAIAAGPTPTATIAVSAVSPLDEATLRAKYGVRGSRFIDVDGEPIHVVDAGKGPAIVLIHGSFASLRQWDGWAKALSPHYRVIRFDRPLMGLSGPNPNGEYSVAREVRVVDEVTRRLGAARFVLVATSSGGAAGVAYAAGHPERITGLILNNIAVPPFKLDTSGLPQAFKDALAADLPLGGYHRPEFWRQVLLHNFVDPRKVTDELVMQWTELNNRAPAMPRAASNPSEESEFDRTPDDLRRITAPTLVIWSADDLDTSLAMGEKVLPLLASTDKTFSVIPRCGHMMPLECGEQGLALATPFLQRIARGAPAR